ncbi:MAG: hypothetical protein AAF984_06770 [Verrucomicrobiota bacterium]
MAETFELWRIVVLFIVLGGLVFISYWLNRGKINFQQLLKKNESQIIVHERKWLSSKESVIYLEVEGQKYLLATSAGGVSWQPISAKSKPEDPS